MVDNIFTKFEHDVKAADMLINRTRIQTCLSKQKKWAEECKMLLYADKSRQE